MKKHLIAVAVAAAVAAPAAMADTTLYGVVHASVDYIDTDNAAGDQEDNIGISSNASRLGVKGSEKISNGLSVIYQYETTVNLTGDGKDLFEGTRNSFVGLSGAFGTGLIGKHDTPMKLVGREYDLFGDQIGDSRNLISSNVNGSPGFDLRPDNVIAYVSPDLMGFQVIGAYVTDHNVRNKYTYDAMAVTDTIDGIGYNANGDNNEFDAYSISLAYKHKFFDIAGAFEEHNVSLAPTAPSTLTDSESAWRIGAGVTYAGLRVNALYQDVSDLGFVDGADLSVWGLGAAYTFGKNVVKAQYYSADEIDNTNDTGADMWAIGYDYKLSKQTTLYAAYAQTDNDGDSTTGGVYTATGGGGHGDNPAVVPGGDSSAFSVGIKHAF